MIRDLFSPKVSGLQLTVHVGRGRVAELCPRPTPDQGRYGVLSEVILLYLQTRGRWSPPACCGRAHGERDRK